MNLTDAEVHQHLETTRVGLLKTVQALRRRRRRHRTLAIGGSLLLAGSGIGAAFAVAQVSAEEARTTVVCFQHDDQASLTTTVASAQGYDPASGKTSRAASTDVKEACNLAFRMGLAAAGPHGEHWPDVKDPNGLDGPSDATYPVPPLAYCYLANGSRAAFPIEAPSNSGTEVCERLGLRPLED